MKKNGKIRYLLGLLMLISLALVSGCKHSLDIKNMSDYSYIKNTPLQKNISIGLMTEVKDMHCDVLVDGIIDSFSKHSSDIRILNSLSGAKEVDVIANVSIEPNYKGSGWNFLINFPGFIVFAPAWNGYIYEVSYDVDVELINSANFNSIDTFDIPIDLQVRHADINRTWTTGMGWLVDYGFTAFVGGIFYVNYDDSVSPILAYNLKSSIGDYIAQKIVNRINESKKITQKIGFDENVQKIAFADVK